MFGEIAKEGYWKYIEALEEKYKEKIIKSKTEKEREKFFDEFLKKVQDGQY
jgi:hypothetical protein